MLNVRTRTAATSLNGSPTTSRPLYVTSHPVVLRCPLPSSETAPPSRSCSSVCPSSSPLCSGVRLSSIGTPERVWTRWSSQRLSPTCTTWYLSTSSTRTPPPRRRVSSTRRRRARRRPLKKGPYLATVTMTTAPDNVNETIDDLRTIYSYWPNNNHELSSMSSMKQNTASQKPF